MFLRTGLSLCVSRAFRSHPLRQNHGSLTKSLLSHRIALPKLGRSTRTIRGSLKWSFGIALGVLQSASPIQRISHVLCEAKHAPTELHTDVVESPTTPLPWTYRELFDILWPEMGAMVAAIMNVHIPLYLGEFVDAISKCLIDREGIDTVYSPTIKLCSSYLVQSLATFTYIGILSSVGERIACRLRNELFHKYIYLDVAYYDVHNSGKLIDSITYDVQTFKSSFKQCISHGLRSSTQIVGSIWALFSISSTLTYTLLGSLPCVFLVGSLMGTELRRCSHKAQLQNSNAASVAEESFTHIRSVKALALEEAQYERYARETVKAQHLNEKLGYGIGAFQGLSNLALNGIVLGVLYVGGHLVSRNELNPGHLMSFLATTQTLQRSLSQLSLLYGHVLRGSDALSRMLTVLRSPNPAYDTFRFDRDPTIDALCERWRQPGRAPELCFDNIQFAYPTRPNTHVLKALSMTVPAGQVVALVGRSGAGKSTVVSLIERFYDPSAGRITLGEHDLSEFPLAALRGQMIGYISQEPQIFNTSIRENIRFGKPNATDEEVEQAARLANAHDFIQDQLSHGYDTHVGQGADAVAGLSGGQRQRIAIARVMLQNAPVLLLDEATSALDAESEAQVQQALSTVMKDRTVLVIAHRLSTVRQADWIIVLSNGRIAEQGTHQDLMQKRGAYHDLVQRQTGQKDLLD